jgi:hypothetical protein
VIPTESELEAAIDRLSPGEFQRLAESYAAIADPSRFGALAVHGRNPRGETTKGWPDAFTFDATGRVDALEASRDARNWGAHLDNDLKHARALPEPGLSGLLFVSWARTPRPGALSPRRKQLAALVEDPQRITLVFRQQLICDLRQAAFAKTWRELRLRVSPRPWAEIDTASVYGGGAPAFFVPSRDEYEAGAVGRPMVWRKLHRRLDTAGWAYIRGLGATGKTVLATQVGLEHATQRGPAYYVDLADPGALLAALATSPVVDAFATAPGKGSRSRWRDLATACAACPEFANELARALRAHPEVLSRLLLRAKRVTAVLDDIEGPLALAIDEHIRTEGFHQLALETALTSGPNRLNSILQLAMREDSTLLTEVDSLSRRSNLVEQAVRNWSAAPTAFRRLLATADVAAPSLARALRAAATNAGIEDQGVL